jgi:ABC-type sugar transport system ATPase subunit
MTEQQKLFELIKGLKERGVCVLLVSHKPSEILQVADRVIGLKDGRIVNELKRADFDEVKLTRLMMGS